jgi:hypothetical protein
MCFSKNETRSAIFLSSFRMLASKRKKQLDTEVGKNLRVCIAIFNNRDLFDYYCLFRRILSENEVACEDVTQKIIQFFLQIDLLWYRGAKKMRDAYFVSNAAIRRIFSSVSQCWLLRFFAGEEQILMRTTSFHLVTLNESRKWWNGQEDNRVFLLGDVQCTVHSEDVDLSGWLEGQSRYGNK